MRTVNIREEKGRRADEFGALLHVPDPSSFFTGQEA
jgi:hypothetical protein